MIYPKPRSSSLADLRAASSLDLGAGLVAKLPLLQGMLDLFLCLVRVVAVEINLSLQLLCGGVVSYDCSRPLDSEELCVLVLLFCVFAAALFPGLFSHLVYRCCSELCR